MRAGLDSMSMPFGKYGSCQPAYTVDQVADEDPGYLRWACESVDMDRWPGLFEHIRETLVRKGELNE